MNVASPEFCLRDYYAWHSRIYDATRWSFLFGRERLAGELGRRVRPRCILEIGCGTGANLARLARLHPGARLVGVDASGDMLTQARRKLSRYAGRIDLREAYYRSPLGLNPAPDLVVFSYSLTMMGGGVDKVVRAAVDELAPGGWVGAVDFHATPSGRFRRWMSRNHVRMEGDIRPLLEYMLPRGEAATRMAYGGLWEYFTFVGRK